MNFRRKKHSFSSDLYLQKTSPATLLLKACLCLSVVIFDLLNSTPFQSQAVHRNLAPNQEFYLQTPATLVWVFQSQESFFAASSVSPTPGLELKLCPKISFFAQTAELRHRHYRGSATKPIKKSLPPHFQRQVSPSPCGNLHPVFLYPALVVGGNSTAARPMVPTNCPGALDLSGLNLSYLHSPGLI